MYKVSRPALQSKIDSLPLSLSPTPTGMRSHNQKLKTTPRPLFPCGFFRHCTQTVLSPTTTTSPTLPFSSSDPPPPPQPIRNPLPKQKPPQVDSESSSSSNTSQSFTQWRFPLPNSPISKRSYSPTEYDPLKHSLPELPSESDQKSEPQQPLPPKVTATNLQELFHVAELQFSTGSESDQLGAIYMLERSLVPNPLADADGDDSVACPEAVMRMVVSYLKEPAGAKPASKVLLALCLVEGNRQVAVDVGAVGLVVEALSDLEGASAERALAALELLCMVEEGAAEVRAHALAVPMMVEMMGRTEGRGKENAISVLAVIYGSMLEGAAVAPPEEVARAVALALQGDCSARGRRKGAQLLKTLQENDRLDLTHYGS